MFRKVAIGLVALALLTTAATAPVAADSPLDGLFDDEDDDSNWIDTITGAASGLGDRISAAATGILGGGGPTATEAADDAQAAFNDHATAFETYANDRVEASTDANVLQVDAELGDETATRYVVADVSNGAYDNASFVDSTDRSVDETCTLSGAAARNAGDEIETFYDRFIEPDENVSTAYMARMTTRYGNLLGGQDVTCSFSLGGS